MNENARSTATKVSGTLGNALGALGTVFLSALFIYWGWGVIAPYLNAPEFSYWEIAGMRFAVGTIIQMFKS